eukprot:486336_1
MGNYFYDTPANNDQNTDSTLKFPHLDVKSQMQLIIQHWTRKNVPYAFGTIIPMDIIRLIIDTFTYQTVFDEENKIKIEQPKFYQTKIQYLQTQRSKRLSPKTKPDTFEYDYLFKLLLIGDSSVGKTSLLRQYVDQWDDHYYTITIGIEFQFKTVNIDDFQIKAQIWDNTGQGRFKTITSSYYRGTHGIILVYDVGNMKTFESLEHWNEEIDKFAPYNVCRMLVGNKTDLIERYHQNGDGIVSDQDCEVFVNKFKMAGSIQTSAKTGKNVDQAFECLIRQILNEKINSERRLIINPFYG